MQTVNMSTRMSQAQALPDHVLTWSAICSARSIFCAFMIPKTPNKKTRHQPGNTRVMPRFAKALRLLRGWLLAEVMVVCHRAVDDDVLLPLHGPLRELFLR